VFPVGALVRGLLFYDMETIEITRKKFTENQETYFKKNKAALTPAKDAYDEYFTTEMLSRIDRSMEQIKAGKGIVLTEEKQKELLGL
jgi:hypothetical protein